MAKYTIQLLSVLLISTSLFNCTHSLHSKTSQTVFISSDDGSLHALNANNGKSKWACKIGQASIQAAPIVSKGLVIIGTSSETGVYAFDALTGNVKWKQPLPNGLIFSACIVDKTIYALTSNKAFCDFTGTNYTTLYALDISAGHIKWSFQAGDQLTRAALSNTNENCPLVRKGTAYFGGNNGTFYAIDTERGTVKWSYSSGASFYASPVQIGGIIYAGDANGSLFALDESTGILKWKIHDSFTIHAGLTTDDSLLFVSYDGPASVVAYSSFTGARRWLFTPTSFISSSPTVANGLLYTSSEEGMLYAIDTHTGTPKWKTRLRSSSVTVPTVVNNIIYVGGGSSMYALDARTGKQKWVFPAKGNIIKSACVQLQDGTVFRGLGNIRP